MARSATRELPEGPVTFVFTDIEGSTRRAEGLGNELWAELLETHHRLLREAFRRHHGVEVKTDGDAFFVVFEQATDAAAAALDGQRALEDNAWPDGDSLRVRMGMHTGEAIPYEGDYVGVDVHRASRICAIGHGGQSLLSQATADLVRDALPAGTSLAHLGTHRLKDLTHPEDVFQLTHPDLRDSFPPLNSLDAHLHNLPIQLTSFIGRDDELLEASKLLLSSPLLTLTGPGGAGKTRLALQLAAELVDDHPHGVWLTDFTSIEDGALVPSRVAGSLGLREERDKTITETVVQHVRDKTTLLVLDNCERVTEACADFARAVLSASPDVRILATSRAPLGMRGEGLYPVPTLETPDGKDLDHLEALAANESVRLFVDRAQLAKPSFQLTPDNAHDIARICRRLDGIPLAIELAAAKTRMMTPREIAERLDDRFRLLTGGDPGGVPHHQTLEATIDWSHDLLTDAERSLFRRLAVFVDGFTAEAAEGVCGEGLDEAEA